MTPRAIMTATSLDHTMGPVAAQIAANALCAVGQTVTAREILVAYRQSGAHRDPYSGDYVTPNHNPPSWGYDNLQDVLSEAGLSGQDLYSAWNTVMGKIRCRWAKGIYTAPRPSTILRWAALKPAPVVQEHLSRAVWELNAFTS